MSIRLDDLFYSGSVVDLHTSIWRAKVKMKPSDLGIEETEEVTKALSLGQHRLVPKSAFDPIEEIARAAQRAVEYYSLPFSMIRGARYVPSNRLAELLGRLKDYKDQFNAAVENFCQEYEQIKAGQMPIIKQALCDAAKTQAAADAAFDRVCQEYPSVDEVKSKCNIFWNIYALQGAKNSAVIDVVQNEAQNVKSIIQEMVVQLRTEFQETLSRLMGLAEKGGKLRKDSLESAYNLLGRLEMVNVAGDSALEEQVKALRRLLDSVTEGVAPTGMLNDLKSIQSELEVSVEQAIAQAEQNLTAVGRRKLAL